MIVSIAAVDFDLLLRKVEQNVNPAGVQGYDEISTAKLQAHRTVGEAISSLIVSLAAAAVQRPLGFDAPLIEALRRALAHPAAPAPLDARRLVPVLSERSDAPVLGWSFEDVRRLLVADLKQHHPALTIDDALLPWENYWGAARASAYALMDLVAFHALKLL